MTEKHQQNGNSELPNGTAPPNGHLHFPPNGTPTSGFGNGAAPPNWHQHFPPNGTAPSELGNGTVSPPNGYHQFHQNGTAPSELGNGTVSPPNGYHQFHQNGTAPSELGNGTVSPQNGYHQFHQNGTTPSELGNGTVSQPNGYHQFHQNGTTPSELGNGTVSQPNGYHQFHQNGTAPSEFGNGTVSPPNGYHQFHQNGTTPSELGNGTVSPPNGDRHFHQNGTAPEGFSNGTVSPPNGYHQFHQNGTTPEGFSNGTVSPSNGYHQFHQNGTTHSELGNGTAPSNGDQHFHQNGTAPSELGNGTAPPNGYHFHQNGTTPSELGNGTVSPPNGYQHFHQNGAATSERNGGSSHTLKTPYYPTAPDNYSAQSKSSYLKLPEGETIQVLTPPAEKKADFDKTIINEALHSSRLAIGAQIQQFIDKKRSGTGAYEPLYEMLSDYPFRTGKMLRPTMCISMARAVGGMGQSALTSAAALELYHNAFLIHDDIEDGSSSRRGKDTLHQMIGVPRAINVGDATNVLAVGLLLENLSLIGVNKTLNVLQEIELMAQQSVEGQAMELDWVATNPSHLSDQDYFKMCVKKTCWYSFMTPCRIGLLVGYPSANANELVELLALMSRFGMILGIAFQIQDDLLNLQGELEIYGKEIGGDIYEGKRTLMLNHAIAHSSPEVSGKILEILALPRPQKTPEQIAFIFEQMHRCGSIEHGWNIARSLANQAAEIFESMDFLQPETPLRPGEQGVSPLHDRRFLKELINYVIYRNV